MNTDAWIYAQQSILGAVLIDERCLPMVISQTHEADFQGTQLTLYRAIRKLFLSGISCDPVSVLNAVGSDYRTFVMDLMQITPTAANVEQYIRVCREQSRASRIRELGQAMTRTEKLEDLHKLLEGATGLLMDRPSLKIVTMVDAIKSFMDRHSVGKAEYLHWPIRELDNHIYAEPGDFIIIGAEPSVGKTAWALQCAWHFSKTHKVGFFSLETTAEKLFDRKMAEVMDIDMGDLKRNNLQHEDWDRVATRTGDVLEMDLELVHASGWTAADIRAATVMQGYQIIFVDYLQLVQGPGKDRYSVVTGVSLDLHTLAQSLGVTVIALSQLTVDNDRNGRPGLDSLRESRQIGQDADVVMMLSLADRAERTGPRYLTVQKNKEGRLSNTLLYFDGSRQSFSKQPRARDAEKQKTGFLSGQLELQPPDKDLPFQ